MKSFKTGLVWIAALSLLASCTKSGALAGSSSGSSGSTTVSGSVSGGLSPISGSTVTALDLNKGTTLGTATTNSTGAFTISLTNPGGNDLILIQSVGGNAGGGTNSNLTLTSVLGTTSNLPASASVNELTTAAASSILYAFNLIKDSAGTVTYNSPVNSAAASSVAAQWNNLMANNKLNTGNSNLSTANQNAVDTVANALANCAQTPSNCSTLFSTAANSSGSAAKNMLDAIYNMLSVTTNATPIYNLGFSTAVTTGFTPQNSTPTALSIRMPASQQTFPTVSGAANLGIAVDASGNIWVCNNNSNSVSEYSNSGGLLGTFTVSGGSNGPNSIGIDASGNIWVGNGSGGGGTLTELNSSGTIAATYTTTGGQALAIDASSNVWVLGPSGSINPSFCKELNSAGTTLISGFCESQGGIAIDSQGNAWLSGNISVKHVSPSGATLQTYPAATSQRGVTVDPSGNVWFTTNVPTVVELSSGGGLLNTFTGVTNGGDARLKFDSAGNLWVGNNGGNTITVLTPTGATLGSYTFASHPRDMAIDQNGNVWIISDNGANIFKIQNVTQGPTFFPFSGPVYSGSG